MEYKPRGRLKVFLGYAAGVGKTYTMLWAVRQRQAEGADVAVALALTHGRKETERLLDGLEIIPTQKISYKGVEIAELAVDAVLTRAPELVVVDELAHTNIPGSRHPKRYMDVEELLVAGIDVYTTLNIQHLESYQDPIEEITGVSVRERVPDRILDCADEVELVDLAPEELLERLSQGKVYIPEQAARAAHKFFKKENLQFLREVSLRKTATIVDTGRGRIRGAAAQSVVPRLLASIGPSPFSERVIRVTKRLADMLKAEWFVVSVETPESVVLPQETKDRIAGHIRLAEELGAKVAILPGEDVAETIYEYALSHGVTQIILGYSLIPWIKRLWSPSPVDKLVKKRGGIDVYVVSSWRDEKVPPVKKEKKLPTFLSMCLAPLGYVAALTLLLAPFATWLRPTAVAFVYLLSSVLAAMLLTPICFFIYVVMAVFMLDLVYITDLEEWFLRGEPLLFSFTTLLVGTVVNQLMTRHRRLTKAAVARHRETLSLYELSKDLVSTTETSEMLTVLNEHLRSFVSAEVILFLKETNGGKKIGGSPPLFDETEEMAACWAIDHREMAGHGTDTLPSAQGLWLPLTVAQKPLGALGFYASTKESLRRYRYLLEAFARVFALSLDRGS